MRLLPIFLLLFVGMASAYPYPTITMYNATVTNATVTSVLVYGNAVSNNWFGGLLAVSLWFLFFFAGDLVNKINAGIVASTIVLIVGVLGNMAGGLIPQQLIIIDLVVLIVLIVLNSFKSN